MSIFLPPGLELSNVFHRKRTRGTMVHVYVPEDFRQRCWSGGGTEANLAISRVKKLLPGVQSAAAIIFRRSEEGMVLPKKAAAPFFILNLQQKLLLCQRWMTNNSEGL